jgi:UDP-GlcNAc:polypeptide alpha-N-acetylglucosaminyltransferase
MNNYQPPKEASSTSLLTSKKTKWLGTILVLVGLIFIIISIATQTSIIQDWVDSSHIDLKHVGDLAKEAEVACKDAYKKVGNARLIGASSGDAAHSGVVKSNRSIFVSIASYRDEQCAPTLLDMYAKAKYPRDLFVGIVEQHDSKDGDIPCIPKQWEEQCQHANWCPSDNVRVRKIAPKDAKGPTYGRYIGALMYAGERFYFMMDSHNRFVTNWDEIIVNMYLSIPYAKPVLSHYPEAWHNPEDQGSPKNAPLDNRPTTTYLCKAKILPGLGYLRLDGFVVQRKQKPRPQPWAAAGFLFAYGRILQDVPFDPHLDFVFDGEEIAYSARMWTSGWNIYSPSENIMYHYYYRVKAKRFWGLLPANWGQRRDAAQRRIQCILEIYKQNTNQLLVPKDTKEEAVTIELEKYGLGKDRSIDDWYKWVGMDRVKWTTQEEKFCKAYS